MRRLIVALTLVLAALGPGPAGAQSYPMKPIRVIVPFAAGGAVDVLARLVGAKMSESIGQPVIIENRAGAAGNVAADAVAKSPPDGYTILQNTNGQAISPALYKSLPFDAVKDFTPVTQLVASQLLWSPPRRCREIGARADRAREGEARQPQLRHDRHRQPAASDHRDVQARGRHRLQAVPYRGDAPLNTALIAGEVHLAVVPFATAKPHVEAGRLRALAIPGAKALTRAAAGANHRGKRPAWVRVVELAGLVRAREYAARDRRPDPARAAKALNAPDVRERMEATANEVVASTPEALRYVFKNDFAKFAKVVKDAEDSVAGLRTTMSIEALGYVGCARSRSRTGRASARNFWACSSWTRAATASPSAWTTASSAWSSLRMAAKALRSSAGRSLTRLRSIVLPPGLRAMEWRSRAARARSPTSAA
jgi:tripartite-type tricarboxylate transporter receptor subunit TctC